MSNLEKKLHDLAKGNDAKSETAKLRNVFDSVEMAIQSGVSRAAILESMNNEGFHMSLKSFDKAMYRIRKARRDKGVREEVNPKKTNESAINQQHENSINKKTGKFEINAPKKFKHNPTPQDDILA
jgi:hypothetical protein